MKRNKIVPSFSITANAVRNSNLCIKTYVGSKVEPIHCSSFLDIQQSESLKFDLNSSYAIMSTGGEGNLIQVDSDITALMSDMNTCCNATWKCSKGCFMCGCKRSERCGKAAWKALKANKQAYEACRIVTLLTILSLICLCFGILIGYGPALFFIGFAGFVFMFVLFFMVSSMMAF